MKYKGIVFDFNGVILWDSLWHEEAWLAVIKELGMVLTEEQIENNHCKTGSEIFRLILGEEASEKEINKWIFRKEEIYRGIAPAKGELFSLSPGCEELFDLLKAKNIPINIATASEINNLKFFIKSFNLAKWFDIEKIVYDDGSLPGKPSPDMYILGAERIGLKPGECLIVEDSRMGLESAKNAGAGKIIALGPEEKREELEQTPGVNKVITQLNEITLDDFLT